MNTTMGAWRKLGIVGAICLVIALGKLRVSGSEAVASTGRLANAGVLAAPASNVVSPPAVLGMDADGPGADDSDRAEGVHFVPAIFAWDPDVRFVYFRHVSKWM